MRTTGIFEVPPEVRYFVSPSDNTTLKSGGPGLPSLRILQVVRLLITIGKKLLFELVIDSFAVVTGYPIAHGKGQIQANMVLIG